MIIRCDSAAIVPNTSELLPDPDTPVKTVSLRFGSSTLNGKGRGQGILLVNGDLKINGTFDWVGLIIVRDDIDKGNGSANITGAVMARNVSLFDGGSTFNGTQDVQYSKCAVESALRGSAVLQPVRERSWAQLF